MAILEGDEFLSTEEYEMIYLKSGAGHANVSDLADKGTEVKPATDVTVAISNQETEEPFQFELSESIRFDSSYSIFQGFFSKMAETMSREIIESREANGPRSKTVQEAQTDECTDAVYIRSGDTSTRTASSTADNNDEIELLPTGSLNEHNGDTSPNKDQTIINDNFESQSTAHLSHSTEVSPHAEQGEKELINLQESEKHVDDTQDEAGTHREEDSNDVTESRQYSLDVKDDGSQTSEVSDRGTMFQDFGKKQERANDQTIMDDALNGPGLNYGERIAKQKDDAGSFSDDGRTRNSEDLTKCTTEKVAVSSPDFVTKSEEDKEGGVTAETELEGIPDDIASFRMEFNRTTGIKGRIDVDEMTSAKGKLNKLSRTDSCKIGLVHGEEFQANSRMSNSSVDIRDEHHTDMNIAVSTSDQTINEIIETHRRRVDSREAFESHLEISKMINTSDGSTTGVDQEQHASIFSAESKNGGTEGMAIADYSRVAKSVNQVRASTNITHKGDIETSVSDKQKGRRSDRKTNETGRDIKTSREKGELLEKEMTSAIEEEGITDERKRTSRHLIVSGSTGKSEVTGTQRDRCLESDSDHINEENSGAIVFNFDSTLFEGNTKMRSRSQEETSESRRLRKGTQKQRAGVHLKTSSSVSEVKSSFIQRHHYKLVLEADVDFDLSSPRFYCGCLPFSLLLVLLIFCTSMMYTYMEECGCMLQNNHIHSMDISLRYNGGAPPL